MGRANNHTISFQLTPLLVEIILVFQPGVSLQLTPWLSECVALLLWLWRSPLHFSQHISSADSLDNLLSVISLLDITFSPVSADPLILFFLFFCKPISPLFHWFFTSSSSLEFFLIILCSSLPELLCLQVLIDPPKVIHQSCPTPSYKLTRTMCMLDLLTFDYI